MVLQKFQLEGQVAIVTGAGRGLGQAMALALAEVGANVTCAARTQSQVDETAAAITKIGRRALAISTDVTNADQVTQMVEQTVAELGRVDILINNAGGGTPGGGKTILEITEAEWHAGIDANLTSAFLCSKAAGKYMVEQRRGKVINISSGWGMRGGRNNLIYCCAKGGVIQFTRALAMTWARDNIQVNCIAPGLFPTRPPRNEEEEKRREATAKFTPIQRLGLPREMGPLAVFLASDASNYMTGAVISLDGGALAGGYAPLVVE